MPGPYRQSSGLAPDIPVTLGKQLAFYDLSSRLILPFKEVNTDTTEIRKQSTGLYTRMKKANWSYRWFLDHFPLSNSAIRVSARCLSSPTSLVVLHLRRFSVGGVYVSYGAAVKPGIGTFRFECYAGDKLEGMNGWTPCPTLRETGSSNTFEFRILDNQLIFLVNGELVEIIRDKSYGRGCPAVEVASHEPDDEFICENVTIFQVM